ncbi:MAG: hypothetical protein CMM35_09420 [Rhodospirillaceae bacterium]|jgi:hypothetical protein|nr:hypothetical protein [Rhodospirillaceae bacterium]
MRLSGRIILVQAIVFVLGSVVMGFEMLASRYLFPYFGGSIETWGALISTVLSALMVGYSLGGYLVDRRPDLRLSSLLIALAAIWLYGLPFLSKPVLVIIIQSFGDGALATISASVVLMFVPLSCLGTLLPFVIRVILTDIDHAGRVAGLSYAISTLGNIFGTLFVTFALIPRFPVSQVTEWLALVAASGSILLYLLSIKR